MVSVSPDVDREGRRAVSAGDHWFISRLGDSGECARSDVCSTRAERGYPPHNYLELGLALGARQGEQVSVTSRWDRWLPR
jgi:hypothetical protein